MSRCLIIGDIHATADSLDEVKRLLTYCSTLSLEYKAIPVFMGDQHHTHSVVNVEVINLFCKAFSCKENWYRTPILLRGNHDIPAGNDTIHSLIPYKYDTVIIEAPIVIDNLIFAPYCVDPNKIIEFCNKNSTTPTLFCHMEVLGAQYDNGFYAKDGVDQNLFPQKTIISGHIHTAATVGKTIYVGSPRWLTLSDANKEKQVVLADFDDSGNLLSTKSFSTGHICRQIKRFSDSSDTPLDPMVLDQKDLNHVDITGNQAYLDERSKVFLELGAKVRTTNNTQKVTQVRESEGVDKAFAKFFAMYKPEHNTPKEQLKTMLETRLGG